MGQVCPNSASTSQHYAPTQCQGVSAYGSAQTGSEKSKLQTSHSSVESKVISRGASCTQEDIRRSLRRDKEAVFTQPKARDTRDSNTDQLLPPGVNVHATKTNHHHHNHQQQQQQQQQNYHNHHHQKQKQPQQKQKQHERERREDITHHVRQNSVKEAKPEGKSDHKHHHHHHHHHHQHRHHSQHQGQRQHEQTPPTTKHQDFEDWNQQQNQQQREGSLQSHKIHGGHRKGPAMQVEQYGLQSQAFQHTTIQHIQQTTIRDSKRGLQLGRGVVPQVEEQHKDSRHRHGQRELQMDSPVGYHTQNAHNAELSARRTQVPNSHKMHKHRPEGIEADALRRSIKEERRLREGRQKTGKEDRKRNHKARLVGDPVYSLPPLVK